MDCITHGSVRLVFSTKGVLYGFTSQHVTARHSTSQHVALRILVAFFLVAALMLSIGDGLHAYTIPTAHACCSGSFYGGDSAKVDTATQNIWPQESGPYCGISTDMAIANYDDLDTGLSLRFTSRNQQYSVASDNGLSGAESQWGYRLQQNNTVAGVSNISYDFGTDPRSIANAAWAYSPNNFYYHNYIYRWQMAHSSEPSYSQEVQEASTIMGSQLENYGEPLSVAINAGAHSVLVTGVYSNNEPLAFFPADITGITFRDPQDSSHWTVPFSTWVSGISGGYSLWSVYYGNGMRPLDGQDPEPQVGPYTPGSGQVHWFRGFNWISRDNNTSGVYWNPDWSYTAYPGTVMTTP